MTTGGNIVSLKCPACNRWLAETSAYGRAVCSECGWEITVRSPEERKLTTPKPAPS